MKHSLFLLLPVCLTVSCQHVPRGIREPLDAARTKVSAIEPGTRRSALEAGLGKPSRTEFPRTAIWETRYDALNFEQVKVRFTSTRKAGEIEWESSRGNGHGISRWQSRSLWKASKGHPRWLWKRIWNRSLLLFHAGMETEGALTGDDAPDCLKANQKATNRSPAP